MKKITFLLALFYGFLTAFGQNSDELVTSNVMLGTDSNQIEEFNPESNSMDPIATDDSYEMDASDTLELRPLTKGENDYETDDLSFSLFSINGVELDGTYPQTIAIGAEGTVIVTASEITFTPSVTNTTITFPYQIKNSDNNLGTGNQIIIVTGALPTGTLGVNATDDFYAMDASDTLELRPLTKGDNDSGADIFITHIDGQLLDDAVATETITLVSGEGSVIVTRDAVSLAITNISFTPSVTDTTIIFNYSIEGSTGGTATATQNVAVTGALPTGTLGVNATDDFYAMDASDTLELRPLTKGDNDSGADIFITHIDGQLLDDAVATETITLVSGEGSVIVTRDAVSLAITNISFTPSVTDTTIIFNYSIEGSTGGTATATQNVAVTGTLPTGTLGVNATDDFYAMDASDTLELRPLTKGDNDSGADIFITHIDGQLLDDAVATETITLVSGEGSVIVTRDAVSLAITNISFTPSVTDTTIIFNYSIEGSTGGTATATQNVAVTGALPTGTLGVNATDDFYAMDASDTLELRPLTKGDNDSGADIFITHIDGQLLDDAVATETITLVSGEGSVIVTRDAVSLAITNISFTPSVTDTTIIFNYSIEGSTGGTATATQNVAVTGALPTGTLGVNATDDFYAMDASDTLELRPLTKGDNDSGADIFITHIDGQLLDDAVATETITLVSGEGSVIVTRDAVSLAITNISFTPSVTDTTIIFNYSIEGSTGGTATATQNVAVTGALPTGTLGVNATDDFYAMDASDTLELRPLTKGDNDSGADIFITHIDGQLLDDAVATETITLVSGEGSVIVTRDAVSLAITNISFTPSVTDTTIIFNYSIEGSTGGTATATQNVAVTGALPTGTLGVNATDDFYAMDASDTLELRPLTKGDNDSGADIFITHIDGQLLDDAVATETITLVSGEGSVIVTRDAVSLAITNISFTPSVTDTTIIFNYSIEGSTGGTATATQNVAVTGALPTGTLGVNATDDFYAMDASDTLELRPLTKGDNDSGADIFITHIDGQLLDDAVATETITLVSGEGSVIVTRDAVSLAITNISFTPSVTDTTIIFNYSIEGSTGGTATATQNVAVTGALPTGTLGVNATDDFYAMDASDTLELRPLTKGDNDSGADIFITHIDGQLLDDAVATETITLVSGEGSVIVTRDAVSLAITNISFTPSVTDTTIIFNYSIEGSTGGTATATQNVAVTGALPTGTLGVNATDDFYAMDASDTLELRPLTKGDNDSGADIFITHIDGQLLDDAVATETITLVSGEGSVIVTRDAVSLAITNISFTPSVTDTTIIFNYSIEGSTGGTATATQNVAVTGALPTGTLGVNATDDFYAMDASDTLELRPLTKGDNDSGADIFITHIDGQLLDDAVATETITLVSGEGSVIVTRDAVSLAITNISFTPSVTDTTIIFNYSIEGSTGGTATATQNVAVTGALPTGTLGVNATDDFYAMDASDTLELRPLTKGDNDSGADIFITHIDGQLLDDAVATETITLVSGEGSVIVTRDAVSLAITNISFTPSVTDTTIIFNYSIEGSTGGTATATQNVAVTGALPTGTLGVNATDDFYAMDASDTLELRPLTKGDNDSGADIFITHIDGQLLDDAVATETITLVSGEGSVIVTRDAVSLAITNISFTPSVTDTTIIFNYSIEGSTGGTATATQNVAVTGALPTGTLGVNATDDFYAMDASDTLELRPLTKGDNDSGADIFITHIDGQLLDDAVATETITLVSGEGSVIVTRDAVSLAITNISFTPSVTDTTIIFNYSIEGSTGGTATATQNVAVTGTLPTGTLGVNATDDFYAMDASDTLELRPLTKGDNDSGADIFITHIDGQLLDDAVATETITLVSGEGSVIVTRDAVSLAITNISFTPSVTGQTIIFNYSIAGSTGGTASATQNIIVSGALSGPGGVNAINDDYIMNANDTLELRPLTKGDNDTGTGLFVYSIDGEVLNDVAITETIPVTGGQVVVTRDAVSLEITEITFTASIGTTGQVTFPYTIEDVNGIRATGLQTITVNGVATGSLTATNDEYTMNQGDVLTIRPLTKGVNDSDSNGLDISIYSIAGDLIDYGNLPQSIDIERGGAIVGAVEFTSATDITFTPLLATTGTVTFPYVIKNTNGDEADASQIIMIDQAAASAAKAATAPNAVDDNYETMFEKSVVLNPLTKGVNDSDPNGDTLTVTHLAGEEVDYNALPQTIIVEKAGVTVGTLIVNGADNITFTPSLGLLGDVVFQYVTSDGNESDTAFTKIAVKESLSKTSDSIDVLSTLSFYPNPSNGNVVLRFDSDNAVDVQIVLSDITGKVIYSLPTKLKEGQNELDFNFDVKPGLMFLNVKGGTNKYKVAKIIFK